MADETAEPARASLNPVQITDARICGEGLRVPMVPNKWTRPPEIEAALAALPPENAPDYLDRLRTGPVEVLVIKRRGATNSEIQDKISELLGAAVIPRAAASVAVHGDVPAWEWDDVASDVLERFWRRIQAGETFFEIRFNLAMKTLVRESVRRRGEGAQRQHERSVELYGELPEDRENVGATDEFAAIEQREIIRHGLDQLPEEQAHAIVLRYFGGLPVFSKDPTEPTIASTLNCSERKARKLLADGEASLGVHIWEAESDD